MGLARRFDRRGLVVIQRWWRGIFRATLIRARVAIAPAPAAPATAAAWLAFGNGLIRPAVNRRRRWRPGIDRPVPNPLGIRSLRGLPIPVALRARFLAAGAVAVAIAVAIAVLVVIPIAVPGVAMFGALAMFISIAPVSAARFTAITRVPDFARFLATLAVSASGARCRCGLPAISPEQVNQS